MKKQDNILTYTFRTFNFRGVDLYLTNFLPFELRDRYAILGHRVDSKKTFQPFVTLCVSKAFEPFLNGFDVDAFLSGSMARVG